MPNSTKKCLNKSEISKIGPDYYQLKKKIPINFLSSHPLPVTTYHAYHAYDQHSLYGGY